jgi:acetylornithine deacetylase
VHVREAGAGANAIEAAYEVIQALHELEARWNEAARSDPHFGHLHHPLNMNVGKIAGGDWASSVPAWCCFETRMAPPPQLPLAEARGEIEACIAAAAARNRFLKNTPPRVEYHGLMADAYVLSGAEAAESALRAAHAQAFGGTALRDLLSTGTTDARFYGCYYGIPALVYGPNAEDIHGFDERVELDSVDRITQSMALFIAEWCGIEPR